MNPVDQHFKEALKALPDKTLSWMADWRIKRRLKLRAVEMQGKSVFWMSFRQLAMVPMALVLLLVGTTSYAFYSPSVVRGDALYAVKSRLELWMYPDSPEDRVAYHLWLSGRRYAEVREILRRKGSSAKVLSFIPVAVAAAPDEMSDLDRILMETLQSASKNMEMAFVITDEIRDVKKVVKVKKQIRVSLKKQKVFLDEVRPILANIPSTMKRKPLPESKKATELVVDVNNSKILNQRQSDTTVVEDLVQTSEQNEAELLAGRAESEQVDIEAQYGYQQGVAMNDQLAGVGDKPAMLEQEYVEMKTDLAVEEDLEGLTMADLLDQEMMDSESVLEHIEKTVAIAEEIGAEEVLLEVQQQLDKQEVGLVEQHTAVTDSIVADSVVQDSSVAEEDALIALAVDDHLEKMQDMESFELAQQQPDSFEGDASFVENNIDEQSTSAQLGSKEMIVAAPVVHSLAGDGTEEMQTLERSVLSVPMIVSESAEKLMKQKGVDAAEGMKDQNGEVVEKSLIEEEEDSNKKPLTVCEKKAKKACEKSVDEECEKQETARCEEELLLETEQVPVLKEGDSAEKDLGETQPSMDESNKQESLESAPIKQEQDALEATIDGLEMPQMP